MRPRAPARHSRTETDGQRRRGRAPISSAGVRKIPMPIVWPTTSALPATAKSAGGRVDRAAHDRAGTKSHAHAKRSANGPPEPTRHRPFESAFRRRRTQIPRFAGSSITNQHAREAGVVRRGGAEDVRHVNKVEHLDMGRFAPRRPRYPRQAEVQRVEGVVESGTVQTTATRSPLMPPLALVS